MATRVFMAKTIGEALLGAAFTSSNASVGYGRCDMPYGQVRDLLNRQGWVELDGEEGRATVGVRDVKGLSEETTLASILEPMVTHRAEEAAEAERQVTQTMGSGKSDRSDESSSKRRTRSP